MAVSYVSSSSNKSTTTSVVIPAPAGIQNNDILMCIVSALHSGGTAIGDCTYPAGWTQLALQTDLATYYTLSILYKRASSESGDYTFGSTSANQMQGAIGLYRGCYTTGSPVDTGSSTLYTTNNTTVRGATVTPTYNNGMLVFGGGYSLAGTISLTTPAGMNARQSQANANSIIHLDDLAYTTAAATGNKDATAGANCTLKHAFMACLRAAPVTSNIKDINGLAYASLKDSDGLAMASVKDVNGLA
jgi:hypothetical protein